jgi:hypothetical protein
MSAGSLVAGAFAAARRVLVAPAKDAATAPTTGRTRPTVPPEQGRLPRVTLLFAADAADVGRPFVSLR